MIRAAWPVAVVLELLVLVASPLVLLVAALLSPFTGGRRPLRLASMLLAYVAHHLGALVACGVLWAVGRRGDTEAHYGVLRWFVAGVTRAVVRAAAVHVHVEEDGAIAGHRRPAIVLSRHAGEGDSLLVVHELLVRHRRRPRIVLHHALRADPLVAVLGARLPNRFVDPKGGDIEGEIAALAGDLAEDDALLIFPEGKNFSPEHRTRAIDRLRSRGHHRQAEQAEAMEHVAAPRPGGALAALAAAPHAEVVVVGHTGFPTGLHETWRLLPERQDVAVRWFVTDEPPAAPEARIDWLYAQWAELDRWAGARSA